MKDTNCNPLIYKIHRGTIDDGPGIRTIVFFKGCPLNCIWCHNPESINYNSEIIYNSEKCIKCGKCETVCPNTAINLKSSTRINTKLCLRCGKCVNVCPNFALKKIGEFYTVDELIKIIMLDKKFYDISGGGVTFSGGEPLTFIDYLEKVMKELKIKGINIVVETCGYFEFSSFKERIMKYIDTIYYDIKFIDPILHKRYTGRNNAIIINNFKSLVKEKSINVVPRVPLIPDLTAISENFLAIADFIKESGVNKYALLPYNSGGISKRLLMQKEIPANLPENMDLEQEIKCRKMFKKRFRSKN